MIPPSTRSHLFHVGFAGILIAIVWLGDSRQPNPVAAQAPAEAEGPLLRVMSFNVRYGTADDGENHWERRKEFVAKVIQDFAPDVVGTQEIWPFQADYLLQHLDGYAYVGKLRVPHDDGGEQCGILFRRDRFVDLEQGHFWLSETPDVPGTQSWDAALPRMVTWVKLFDRERGQAFYFFNTHFDHRGVEARTRAAEVLRARLGKLDPSVPVLLAGDFNCGEDSMPYTTLLAPDASEDGVRLLDTFRVAFPMRTAREGTFNGFQGRTNGARIDWILASTHFSVESAAIVTDADGHGRYPSDHFPVTASVRWP